MGHVYVPNKSWKRVTYQRTGASVTCSEWLGITKHQIPVLPRPQSKWIGNIPRPPGGTTGQVRLVDCASYGSSLSSHDDFCSSIHRPPNPMCRSFSLRYINSLSFTTASAKRFCDGTRVGPRHSMTDQTFIYQYVSRVAIVKLRQGTSVFVKRRAFVPTQISQPASRQGYPPYIEREAVRWRNSCVSCNYESNDRIYF